jgi:cell division control protein 24
MSGAYALQVWWRGDDDLEYFTLRCRTEEQVKQWETVIMRMVADVQSKREERHRTAPSHHTHYDRASAASSVSTLPAYTPTANTAHQRRTLGSYPEDNKNHYGGYNGGIHQPPYSAHAQPNGWRDGFDDRDDEYDEDGRYPNGPMSAGGYSSASGRETPQGPANARRGAVSDREYYERPRRGTEDATGFQQWRQQQHASGPTGLPGRPHMSSRSGSGTSGASGMSMQSIQSDASFGNGIGHHRPPQPMLRTQLSSGRLRTQYEERGMYDDGQLRHSQVSSRTRVVSNPSTSHALHQAQMHSAPPVPIAPQWTGSSQSSGSGGVDPSRIASGPSRERLAASLGGRNGSSLAMVRPASGGSSDTGDSSEHSPDGGHHPTSSGGTLRGSRSQIFNGNSNPPPGYTQNGTYAPTAAGGGYGVHSPVNHQANGAMRGPVGDSGPPVKIKVYWLDDLFVIMVPRTTGFIELVQRVQKKIRLCGGGNTEGPLRLKYDDEDGDRISLSTDEELQMAFDMCISRSNGQGQLTLRVH